ncbi:penicillin-binding protein 2 [Actinomycetota bacterium]
MYQARLWTLVGVVVLLFGTLIGRLGQMQIGEHTAYSGAAEQLNTRTIVTPAVRGRILDRNRVPLVDNTSEPVVTVERKVLLESDDEGRALITRVAKVLGLPANQLFAKTRICGTEGAPRPPLCWGGSAYQPIPIAAGVDPRRALSLTERPEDYPGVAVEAQPVRHFPRPDGVNAAHVIGYLGRPNAEEVRGSKGAITDQDLVGRAGLEQQYDSVLRGTPGRTVVAVDPRGIVTREVSRTDPVAGRDIVTTIDAGVQAATEKALAQGIQNTRAKGRRADAAAAVVLDPRNGDVVAMASYPTYDPDVWTGGISQADFARLNDPKAGTPLVSRAVASVFPPASTFKAITLPAAVEGGGASLDGTYQCGSSYRIGNRDFRNFESTAYGRISLRTAMVVSCDTVFYEFAYRSWLQQGGLEATTDAKDPFVAMAKRFGFGSRTGIDLPGEAAGRIPGRPWKRQVWEDSRDDTCARAKKGYPEIAKSDPQRAAYLKRLAAENCTEGFSFRAGDEANLSIGQGDMAVTPLQMTSAYAAIAAGGLRWTPRLVGATARPDGSGRTAVALRKAGDVGLSGGLTAFLHDALAGVVTEGTARGAFAGFDLRGWPVAGKTGTAEVFGQEDTAWFVSWAPADSPRYAVSVTIAQGGTGGDNAAPVARTIHDYLRGMP